jgi:hypothetical protein
MPSTYELIKGETIGSAAASYTFTAIPSTYTDLVVRISARGSDNAYDNDVMYITFNGTGGTAYSVTRLYANGASAFSNRSLSQAQIDEGGGVSGGLATSNTFSSFEMYVPNYTGTTQKPISIISLYENNGTTARMFADAALVNITSAFTSITLDLLVGNFVSGSSFYLYGISKS